MKTNTRSSLALLALVLVAALVTASCSTVTPTALTVGGWSLSEEALIDQLDALTPESEQGNGWSTALASQLLNAQVLFQVASDEVAERGLEVSETDLRNAEVQLSAQFSPTGGQGDGTTADPAGLAVLDELSDDTRDELVRGYASFLVLGADILDRAASDEGLRELFEAQSQEQRACASHILVQAGDGTAEPTEAQYAEALAEIEAIAGRLDGTSNFGALAAEVSDDPGSASAGGELGCAPEGAYVPEFDEVVWSQPVGVVSEPVRTSFGYHLVLVTARGEVSFEDARSQLARAVQQNGQAIVGDALGGLLTEADVSVDPKWGQWDAETGQVLPPAGAQPPPMATPDLEGLEGLPEGLLPAEG